MSPSHALLFGPYRLDPVDGDLHRGQEVLELPPKPLAVLCYLAKHRGRLVSKEELLDSVWGHRWLSEAVLKTTIKTIRRVLQDDPKAPRYIETRPRRGYRFIAELTSAVALPLAEAAPARASLLVGREQMLVRLRGVLEKALRGERQVVFVTGEPGIGKTVLIEAFVQALGPGVRSLRGQCIEQYGQGEPYAPVLEALNSLGREAGEPLLGLMRQYAPTWLVQMPWFLSEADRALLQREVLGTTKERMLREMGEFLERWTGQCPLILVLEDLHWSDYPTLDLISYLPKRRDAARLMLIGTYRPVEVIVSGHPLKAVKQELLSKRQCEELPLEYLSEDAVAQYLAVRFPANRFPAELGGSIHERTEGNPLFMVNAVDYLVTEGLIAEAVGVWQLGAEIEKIELGVPYSIKQMIEKQIGYLSREGQRMLEAASVSGVEFSTPTVAAGLGEDAAVVEAQCEELARRHQFIRDGGFLPLPNGEVAARYGFIHALYQNVLYERVSAAKRVHLHRRAGERGEELYGERSGEIAAELAMHFERGRDHRRAVKYLEQATETAIRRFAYQEAIVLARRGLELLQTLPDTSERVHQELRLHIALGVPLTMTQGFAAQDVGRTYARALELCEPLGETPDIFQVLWGLRGFHSVRAELEIARGLAERILRLARRVRDPALLVRGHLAMEVALTNLGEFPLALKHFEELLSLYDPEQHGTDACRYVLNPASAPRCFAAWALCLLGLADQALSRIQEALILARESSDPHGLTHVLFYAAVLHQLRREERLAQERAEAAIIISTEHGLMHYLPQATIIHGWTLAEQGRHLEGIEQMREGLAAYEATGAKIVRPHLLALLAEALGKAGRPAEGLMVLAEALVVSQHTGNHYYDAELYRLKGELLLMQAAGRHVSPAATGEEVVVEDQPTMAMQAESCLNEAVSIAQKQRAKSWELRAVMSLARLYQKQGRKEEARRMLEETYGWFTEGFDTADLKEAKEMLDRLS
ncbi:MAG: AAA family ATPase [Gammaproteobacteria bacterium]